jgi:alkylation response protein AidB-like acyl-CoA dehydrogenase
MIKAYATKITREIARVCREVMGEEGILRQNNVILKLMDGETAITGEGTYEMNVLVAGRELTGLQAYF